MRSEEMLIKYTDILADKLESLYPSLFKGAKIDRAMLFGELYFHYDCMVNDVLTEYASVADVKILANGNIHDDRQIVQYMSAQYAKNYK